VHRWLEDNALARALSDLVFVARTFIRAGLARPGRPDRVLGALLALHRWGTTLAGGYVAAAARYPHDPALIDELGTLTFAELDSRTNALANGLRRHGIGPRAGVAIMCRNHRGFVEASVACSKLGAHALYLNTAFAAPLVTAVVEREDPVAVVYDQEFSDAVAESSAGRTAFVAWVDDPAQAAHSSLEDVIAASDRTPPSEPGRTVILTSGTTGPPKGANRASPGSLAPAAGLLSRIPLRAREITLIAAPLFHAWGFAHMFLGTALGSTLLLRRRFDAEDTVATLAEQRASALVVVPVMLQRIVELPDAVLDRYDTSSLRVIAVSGSALSGTLARRAMDRFGEVVYNLYGSTEVAWATIADPSDLRLAPGTAGRPPRGTTVKLLDEEGNEVAPGASGVIFVGSELLFEGYTSGADKARFGALMSTGDVGHFDPGGRLFIDGRDDDMIVSGGENVYPGEVEELLHTVAGVREAAVVGVPDDQWGQRLRAFVEAENGAALTEQGLRDYVRANLAGYKVPRDVVFVEELPRNATGKVLKRELRAKTD
jgi:acyl-CoA synthetase (AMP-forming)/AMP-acid ligase II